MALTHITDFVTSQAARVLSQYRALPKMMGLIAQLDGAVQEAEDALWGIVDMLNVATAQGVWLDWLGKIVGQAREGHDDNFYRQLIAARIIANASNGTIEDLLNTIRAGYNASPGEGFVLTEWTVAAVSIFIPPGLANFVESDPLFQSMLKVMRAARAAGVKLTLFYSPDTPGSGNLFVYDDATNPGHVVGKGFADADDPGADGIGGFLSGANDA